MPITKRAQLSLEPDRVKDLGHGVVEVIVATETIDHYGEKIAIDGINLKKYNNVVLWGHDYTSLPIGKSISMKKKDGQLISKTEFAIKEYPFAKTVYEMVVAGFIPDVSIGFIPKEWDADKAMWTQSDMVEYSHVPIGANPEAKVTGKALQALEAVGLSVDDFEAQQKDFMGAKPIAKEAPNVDNDVVVDLLNSIKHAVGSMQSQVDELKSLQATTSKPSSKQTSPAVSKRTIKLGKKRILKTAKAVDGLTENLISSLNQ